MVTWSCATVTDAHRSDTNSHSPDAVGTSFALGEPVSARASNQPSSFSFGGGPDPAPASNSSTGMGGFLFSSPAPAPATLLGSSTQARTPNYRGLTFPSVPHSDLFGSSLPFGAPAPAFGSSQPSASCSAPSIASAPPLFNFGSTARAPTNPKPSPSDSHLVIIGMAHEYSVIATPGNSLVLLSANALVAAIEGHLERTLWTVINFKAKNQMSKIESADVALLKSLPEFLAPLKLGSMALETFAQPYTEKYTEANIVLLFAQGLVKKVETAMEKTKEIKQILDGEQIVDGSPLSNADAVARVHKEFAGVKEQLDRCNKKLHDLKNSVSEWLTDLQNDTNAANDSSVAHDSD